MDPHAKIVYPLVVAKILPLLIEMFSQVVAQMILHWRLDRERVQKDPFLKILKRNTGFSGHTTTQGTFIPNGMFIPNELATPVECLFPTEWLPPNGVLISHGTTTPVECFFFQGLNRLLALGIV